MGCAERLLGRGRISDVTPTSGVHAGRIEVELVPGAVSRSPDVQEQLERGISQDEGSFPAGTKSCLWGRHLESRS